MIPGQWRDSLPHRNLPPSSLQPRQKRMPRTWSRRLRRSPNPPCIPHLLRCGSRRQHPPPHRLPLRRWRLIRHRPCRLHRRPAPQQPRLQHRYRLRQSAASTTPGPGGTWSTTMSWSCRTPGAWSGREDTAAPHRGAGSIFRLSTSRVDIPWTSSRSWCLRPPAGLVAQRLAVRGHLG